MLYKLASDVGTSALSVYKPYFFSQTGNLLLLLIALEVSLASSESRSYH
jgi:hypothetical protein